MAHESQEAYRISKRLIYLQTKFLNLACSLLYCTTQLCTSNARGHTRCYQGFHLQCGVPLNDLTHCMQFYCIQELNIPVGYWEVQLRVQEVPVGVERRPRLQQQQLELDCR